MDFNERISALRKRKKLTQEQLGAMLGVTGQAVSKWENKESMPDVMLLSDLCVALDTSVGYLLALEEESRVLPAYEQLTELNPDIISYYLRPLSNEKHLHVLKNINKNTAVTRDELMAATGYDFDTINNILNSFFKRSFITCKYDADGKQGYLLGSGYQGLYFILAGCSLLNSIE